MKWPFVTLAFNQFHDIHHYLFFLGGGGRWGVGVVIKLVEFMIQYLKGLVQD